MGRRTLGAVIAAVAAAGSLLVSGGRAEAAGLTTSDLRSGVTAADLAQDLAGAGVAVSNVTYTGAPIAAGRFAGGGSIVGFESGVALSSGGVPVVVGPNQYDDASIVNDMPGDADLDTLVTPGLSTFDAAVLEFDFVPDASTVRFQYVFASEEYNEYVNSAFDDVFAFFVNGQNCAVVPGTGSPVSINTINNGNPIGINATHPEWYRNNDLEDGGGSIDTEMDGLTKVLTCESAVAPNATNHMKLAVADTSDQFLDTSVFLKSDSLTTAPPPPPPPLPPPDPKPTRTRFLGAGSATYSDPANLAGDLADVSEASPLPLAGKPLTFSLGGWSSAGPLTDGSGFSGLQPQVLQRPGSVTEVEVDFAGDAGYLPSTARAAFTISKESCTTTYTGPSSVAPGSPVTLSAAFGEDDASPGDWTGKRVDFTLQRPSAGPLSYSALTNGAGSASVTANVPPGSYTVTPSFPGDDFYLPCGGSARSLVVQSNTAVGADPVVAQVVPGANVYLGTLSATLRSVPAGVPLPGRTINFWAGSTFVCSAGTNAQGRASCTSPVASVQAVLSLGYEARFAGDAGPGPVYLSAKGSGPVLRVNGSRIP